MAEGDGRSRGIGKGRAIARWLAGTRIARRPAGKRDCAVANRDGITRRGPGSPGGRRGPGSPGSRWGQDRGQHHPGDKVRQQMARRPTEVRAAANGEGTLILLYSNFLVKLKQIVHFKNPRDLPPDKLWPGKEFPERSLAAFGIAAIPKRYLDRIRPVVDCPAVPSHKMRPSPALTVYKPHRHNKLALSPVEKVERGAALAKVSP